ncbi:LysR family transcriptional regulator [Achromobacter sp. GG226]|uniref:LysR family transcriptional regulator n=1 Tax=Verticiella alkaliphila TaxID=2779529 RepID=UPI001C0CF91E|nr:LysR family transcriptional regulator [Verticiella sp. GG226]MBU4610799.1 LysR family transcriptional regulator [Verticiella sp. GG226]
MDRFDAMQAFARVVETGSFTRAASTLHMSKTTVTQLVQQLEARLRVKLLHRTTRKVNVTADGAAYYEHVVRLLGDLDDAETSLSAAATVPRGRLRVDVPSPLARFILIPALPAFQAAYPDIQLDLGVSDRKVDLIDENVDCVIRGGQITDESLVAKPIGALGLGVYAAPGYLAHVGMPQHPKDLIEAPHRVIGFLRDRRGKPMSCVMQRGDERIEILGRHTLWVDDGNAYLAAGVAGLGALWLPHYMAREAVANGELVPLLTDWTLDPMPLFLAYRPNRHVSAKLRVFMEWVAGVVDEAVNVPEPRTPQTAGTAPRARHGRAARPT